MAGGLSNPLDVVGLGIFVSLKYYLPNRIEFTFTVIVTTSAIDEPPLGRDKAEMQETSDMTAKKKRRMPLIPFTRSWRERRRARKESPEIMIVINREAAEEAEVSPPQTVPIQLTMNNAVTKTQMATEPHSRKEKTEKTLAQYGHHEGKGAAGWVALISSADRPYPRRQYVNGQRVLAQYGHHDNKWAVKHPVY